MMTRMGMGKVCGGLSLLLVLQVCALLVFLSGFLLHRHSPETTSSCDMHPLMGSRVNISQSDGSGNVTHTAADGQHTCWLQEPPRFKRAVVLVIDALRFDFATANPNKDAAFANQITVFDDLVEQQPNNSLLFRFRADAPTTTMQRIKGITTGSLPTFLDIGSSFASSEIVEDSFVQQIASRTNGSTAFVGDDTWMDLFPRAFTTAHPFPSFNVRDLDTVDNGVKKHLPRLLREDHALVVGHFLGVDHCGHRYGPNHPAMSAKLRKMDAVLRSVVRDLPDDALLVVLGDHGMTTTGDHGGDSESELEAALFMYSKGASLTSTAALSRLRSSLQDMPRDRSVDQIDLAATLPLLLGHPIPHGSLGSVIPEAFLVSGQPPPERDASDGTGDDRRAGSSSGAEGRVEAMGGRDDAAWAEALQRAVGAARVNAHQVNAFLTAYTDKHPDFDVGDRTHLEQLLVSGDAEATAALRPSVAAKQKSAHLLNALKRYRQFTTAVQTACRRAWTEFNIPAMAVGVVMQVMLVICALLGAAGVDPAAMITPTTCRPPQSNNEGGGSAGELQKPRRSASRAPSALLGKEPSLLPAVIAFLGAGLAAFFVDTAFNLSTIVSLPLPIVIAASAGSAALVVLLVSVLRRCTKARAVTPDRWQAVFLVAVLLHTLSSFSNSFVVYDDRVTSVLLVALVVLRTLLALRHGTNTTAIVLAALLCCGALRSAHVLRVCREEQEDCTPTFSAEWSATAGPSNLAVIVVLAVHSCLWLWLKAHENLYGVAWFRYRLLFAPMVLCLGMEWASEFLVGQARAGDSATDTSTRNLVTERAPFLFAPQVRVLWARIVFGVALSTAAWCVSFGSMTTTQARDDPDKGREVWVHGLPSRSTAVVAVVGACVVDMAMVLVEARFVLGLGLMLAAAAAYLWLIAEENIARVVNSQRSSNVTKYKVAVDRSRRSAAIIPSAQQQQHKPTATQSQHAAHTPVPLTSPTACDVCVWFLFSVFFFYFTGHQTTLPTVRWTSGLVGLNEMNYVISGTFVWTVTFTSAIVFALCLPLLITATQLSLPRTMLTATQEWSGVEGDFWLFTSKLQQTRRRFYALCLLYAGLSTARLASSMAAALVLRRHLMVWKIFAPRLMFEGATSITVLVVLLLSALLVGRLAVFGRKAALEIARINKRA